MERQCIFPKDIQFLLGRSERFGRELITKIKTQNNKLSHQFVTVEEFCHYTGLNLQNVKEQLNKRPY